jgi:hypothetical protein
MTILHESYAVKSMKCEHCQAFTPHWIFPLSQKAKCQSCGDVRPLRSSEVTAEVMTHGDRERRV